MKKTLIILGIIVLAIGVFFFFIDDGPEDGSSVTKTEKFIIANPIDLEQIASISQFRSCFGHDYSGKNVDGERETLRSMKHYITPKNEFIDANAIAPFNGKISSIGDESIERGSQVWLRPDDVSSWNFIFFHIVLEPGFKKGIEVKAGEVIGKSALREGENFDFALKRLGFGGQTLDSPFNYMTEEILAEYEARGVTPENVIISKEHRDASPCNFGVGSGQEEQVFLKY